MLLQHVRDEFAVTRSANGFGGVVEKGRNDNFIIRTGPERARGGLKRMSLVVDLKTAKRLSGLFKHSQQQFPF